MGLKQIDRIEEAIQIAGGIRDLLILFEEGKDVPYSVYIVFIVAIEKAVRILEEVARQDNQVS